MICVAFGANLPSRVGDPVDTYREALKALENSGVKVLQKSSLWKTSPVDTPDEQPWYVNAVMEVGTTLPPRALLELLLSIEAQFGRVRTFKNAPKSIDMDLICYHDEVLNSDPALQIPHPRMHGRAFVLLPMQEIAGEWTHPALRKSLKALIDRLPADQQIEMLEAA